MHRDGGVDCLRCWEQCVGSRFVRQVNVGVTVILCSTPWLGVFKHGAVVPSGLTLALKSVGSGQLFVMVFKCIQMHAIQTPY